MKTIRAGFILLTMIGCSSAPTSPTPIAPREIAFLFVHQDTTKSCPHRFETTPGKYLLELDNECGAVYSIDISGEAKVYQPDRLKESRVFFVGEIERMNKANAEASRKQNLDLQKAFPFDVPSPETKHTT
jgi:hypothetical protein